MPRAGHEELPSSGPAPTRSFLFATLLIREAHDGSVAVTSAGTEAACAHVVVLRDQGAMYDVSHHGTRQTEQNVHREKG